MMSACQSLQQLPPTGRTTGGGGPLGGPLVSLPPLPTSRTSSKSSLKELQSREASTVSKTLLNRNRLQGSSEENLQKVGRRPSSGLSSRSGLKDCQDLRRNVLTASLSSSCPDLLDDDQSVQAKVLLSMFHSDSRDSSPSRALGIGLQKRTGSSPMLSRRTKSSNRLSQASPPNSDNATACMSTNQSNHSSHHTDGKVAESPHSTPQAVKKPILTRTKANASAVFRVAQKNGHHPVYRTDQKTGNIFVCMVPDALPTELENTPPPPNVLKLTKENVEQRLGTYSPRQSPVVTPHTTPVKLETKKQSKSLFKNLFGLRSKKNDNKNNTEQISETKPEVITVNNHIEIPEFMSKATFDRCCAWLEEVEKAKNTRCPEVSADPPAIWAD